MQLEAYQLMAAAEETHWWFRGRRAMIRRVLETIKLPSRAHVLDAGCGTGGNLPMLSQFGKVYGFEYDATARQLADARGLAIVSGGALPHEVPFAPQAFDLIGLFDVLEHLEHPVESLRALGERLAPGGALVLTVPAYQWLWGPHDELHEHKRRYSMPLLREQVKAAGLEVAYASHMNSLLLPAAVAQRVVHRFTKHAASDLTPGAVVNETFYRIWSLERAWIPKLRVPFGLSIIAVLRRGAPSGAPGRLVG
jgi:SAM-dependent methyltransferase